MPKSAIYKITNTISGKFYIGSTNNISRRWIHHRSLLRNKKHHNKHLQHSYNKHGIENFIFEVLEEVAEENLITREQELLDTLKPFGDKGYNISKVAGSPMAGMNHTEEVKQLLSQKLSGENHPHYGKPVSEKWRRNISKAHKRFTDEEESSFRKRWEAGESKNSIAKSIGVHPTTIHRAIERSKRFKY
jgi:group I intron endonuclease